MSQYLLFSFSFVSITSSIIVVSALNPVYSVFFLVLVFLSVSGMLFTVELDFLPLGFVIVYVGAIAILFLFVVMMLSIKLTSLSNPFFNSLPVLLFFLVGFYTCVYVAFSSPFVYTTFLEDQQRRNISWALSIDVLSNVEALGHVLYTYYFILLLISGIVLLVAMVGSISLTLQFNKKLKSQFLFRQLSRKMYNALFLIQN